MHEYASKIDIDIAFIMIMIIMVIMIYYTCVIVLMGMNDNHHTTGRRKSGGAGGGKWTKRQAKPLSHTNDFCYQSTGRHVCVFVATSYM